MLDSSTNQDHATRWAARVFVACRGMLLVLALSSMLLAADTLARLETATAIQVCPSCTEVRALLVPDEKSTIKLDEGPKVEAAYFSGATPRDAAKFSAKWVGKKFPRQISMTLDPNETKEAGTYDLYIDLQPDSNPGAGRLKVQFTRPPATIETIPKLIIDRTYWFIWASSDALPDLLVTETSKKSALSISDVRPLSNSSVGTQPIGGRLKFASIQAEIMPGSQASLKYSLDGRFPLGNATGTMKVDAPQLANPVSFDFEVRSRVHWIYIGITIAVGLMISYLIKVRLQQKIEFDQAHLDAQTLVERITREAERHADPVFVAAYRHQLDALTAAMGGNNAVEINAAKLALDIAWQAALQNLSRRHQDQLDALDKLRDVTNYDWLVPPEIAQAIGRARTAQAEVVQLIENDDLTRAGIQRQQIIFDLRNDIRAAAMAWQTNEQQILATIQTAPLGVSVELSTALTKPATDLLGSLRKVDGNTQLAAPEQIQQTLSDLKFERTSVQQFFQWLSNAIQMERATAEAAIPNPPPPAWDAAKFSVVSITVTQFTTFLNSLVDHPDPPGLPGQLATVHRAWTNALQSQFAAPNSSVQVQLDARDYVQATKVAFQQKIAGVTATSLLAVPMGPAFTAPEFYRDVFGAAALPIYAIRTRFQAVATPSPALPTSVTDAATLKRDKLTQSLIVGVLLVVVGYGLQLNTFVGTFADFSTLFFWAFALDLTVDQLGKVTKKG